MYGHTEGAWSSSRETWRETAKNMFIVGMINLGKKWFDDRTYNEILEKALNEGKNGIEYLRDIQIDVIIEIMEDYDREEAEFLTFGPYEDRVDDIDAYCINDEEYKEGGPMIENMKLILSEEFAIIASVVRILSEEYPLLPAAPKRLGSYGPHRNPPPSLTSVISKMIDPIPYVMQACAYIKDDQDVVIYAEY